MSFLHRRPGLESARGVSLIELMVSLVIGSLLIIGVTQVYIDNQRSYLFQQSQGGNQENARFAEFVLNEYFSKAGYRRAPDQPVDDAFPARASDDHCKAFDAGSSVTATLNGVGLCVRYQPLLSTELDCQGDGVNSFTDDIMFKPSPTNSLLVLAIRYQPAGEGEALDAGTLQCRSVNSASGAWVELLRGVADFRLDFGVGNPGLLERTLKADTDNNRFMKAQTWATTNGPIRAVRYSILMASRENMRDSDDSAVLDNWLQGLDDAGKTTLQANDNRRIYQIAHSTRNLRNLMP